MRNKTARTKTEKGNDTSVDRYTGWLIEERHGMWNKWQAVVLEYTRFITSFFFYVLIWNGQSINVFIFIENCPKRKIHPEWFLISKIYQWVYGYTKRKHTYNIQICTSCMWVVIIYRRTFVPRPPKDEHSVTAAPVTRTPGRAVRFASSYTVPLLQKRVSVINGGVDCSSRSCVHSAGQCR